MAFKHRHGYERSYPQRRAATGITSTYFVLGVDTSEYRECQSARHACAIAFGKNKQIGRIGYLACMRTSNYFVCLEPTTKGE